MKIFASKVLLAAVAASIMLVPMLSVSACAEGGIIFKNMKMTNNGKEVFADSLQDRSDKWTQSSGATFEEQGLELNMHGRDVVQVERGLNAEKVGLVEINFDARVAPANEQFFIVDHAIIGSQLDIISGTTLTDSIRLDIDTRKDSKLYNLGLVVFDNSDPNVSASSSSYTVSGVLPPDNWAHFTLRMNPYTKRIYLQVEGKQILSVPYNPSHYLSLRTIDLSSTLGDGISGGMMVKNIQLKTGDSTVFSDACTGNELSKEWQNNNGVSISSKGMVLNKHGKDCLSILRAFDAKLNGITEFSADVWIAQREEQYGWKNSCLFSKFSLGSASRFGYMEFSFFANSNVAYPAELYWTFNLYPNTGGDEAKTTTDKAVITPNKWTHIKLVMDANKRVATLYSDDKLACSLAYNPDDFKSLEKLIIATNCGDGSLLSSSSIVTPGGW